jgi:hypothetical protein
MYIDKLLLLSDGQSVASSAESYYSIPLSVARDLGAGKPLYAVIVVDAAAAGGTSLTIALVTDDVAVLSSPTVLVQTRAILAAELTLGRTPIVIPVCDPVCEMDTYLGLYYTSSGTLTSCTVTAFLTTDPPKNG